MAYLRVRPAGVNRAFNLSVYALWSAYGTTWPRVGCPFFVVFITRHSICAGSKGTSRAVTSFRTLPCQNCCSAGETEAEPAVTGGDATASCTWPLGPVISWSPSYLELTSLGMG